jgi:hypothetical protein
MANLRNGKSVELRKVGELNSRHGEAGLNDELIGLKEGDCRLCRREVVARK